MIRLVPLEVKCRLRINLTRRRNEACFIMFAPYIMVARLGNAFVRDHNGLVPESELHCEALCLIVKAFVYVRVAE